MNNHYSSYFTSDVQIGKYLLFKDATYLPKVCNTPSQWRDDGKVKSDEVSPPQSVHEIKPKQDDNRAKQKEHNTAPMKFKENEINEKEKDPASRNNEESRWLQYVTILPLPTQAHQIKASRNDEDKGESARGLRLKQSVLVRSKISKKSRWLMFL